MTRNFYVDRNEVQDELDRLKLEDNLDNPIKKVFFLNFIIKRKIFCKKYFRFRVQRQMTKNYYIFIV